MHINKKYLINIFSFLFAFYFFSQQSENYFKKGIFVLSLLCVFCRSLRCWLKGLNKFFPQYPPNQGFTIAFKMSIRLICGFFPHSRLSWRRLTRMRQWRPWPSTKKWRNHRRTRSRRITTTNTTPSRPSRRGAFHHKSGLTWSEFRCLLMCPENSSIVFFQKILLLRRRDPRSPRRTGRQPRHPARRHEKQHRFLREPEAKVKFASFVSFSTTKRNSKARRCRQSTLISIRHPIPKSAGHQIYVSFVPFPSHRTCHFVFSFNRSVIWF